MLDLTLPHPPTTTPLLMPPSAQTFCIAWPEDVRASAAVCQRSQTTGELLVRAPAAQAARALVGASGRPPGGGGGRGAQDKRRLAAAGHSALVGSRRRRLGEQVRVRGGVDVGWAPWSVWWV